MMGVFKRGKRSDEILDLTSPADDDDGIVDRWLREAMARRAPEPTARPPQVIEKPAV
jgi:hypothetical protein